MKHGKIALSIVLSKNLVSPECIFVVLTKADLNENPLKGFKQILILEGKSGNSIGGGFRSVTEGRGDLMIHNHINNQVLQ